MEFSRQVISTETIRKMDRDDLEAQLRGLRVPLDDTASDDDLRELLVSSVEYEEARES